MICLYYLNSLYLFNTIQSVELAFLVNREYPDVQFDKTLSENTHLERITHAARLFLWTSWRICGKHRGLFIESNLTQTITGGTKI